MTALANFVGRETLDVVVSSEELAFALRTRLADLNRDRLVPAIARVLDEVAIPGHHVRIGRLTLDLGDFSPGELETYAEEQLVNVLRGVLSELLHGGGNGHGSVAQWLPERIARRELLEHALLHGAAPTAFSLNDTVQTMIAGDPQSLDEIVRAHGRHDYVLERIVLQLDEAVLRDLIRVLEPRHAALILDYVGDLQEVHRTEPVLPLGDRDFSRVVWIVVTAYLVRDPGSQFNRKSFVKSLLEDIARREGFAYADILEALRIGLDRTLQRHPLRSSLPAVVAELVRELSPEDAARNAPSFDNVLDHLRPAESATIRRLIDLFNQIPAPYRPRPEDRLRQAFVDALLGAGRNDEALGPLFYTSVLRELFAWPLAEPVSRFLLAASAAGDAFHTAVLAASGSHVMAASRATSDAEIHGEIESLLARGADGAALLRRYAADARTRRKWAELLSEDELARVASIIAPRRRRVLLAAAGVLAAAWRETAPPGHPALTERPAFWRFMLGFLARNPATHSVRQLVSAFFDHSAAHYLAVAPVAPEFTADGERLLERATHLARRGGHGVLLSIFHRDRRVLLAPWERVRRARVSPRTQQWRSIEEPEAESAPIYIDNAGIVLAAPFLPRIFSILELYTNGEDGKRPAVKDIEAASRAVHIIQFLADGRTSAPEASLVLNKILAGVPSRAPIERAIEPTDQELELCDKVLRSVIAGWTAIENTSIEGLQETFFQRPGKLWRIDDGWKLEVQRKTVDVLLDDVPWNKGIIALQWMAQPLYVTW